MITSYYAYIAECIGTMILCILLFSTINPIPIGLGYMLIKYSLYHVSGAFVNPAVTLAMVLDKQISIQDFLPYVVAQGVGAIVGYEIHKYFEIEA